MTDTVLCNESMGTHIGCEHVTKRIDEMWAFVTTDPTDDTEGVIGMSMGTMGWMPFVCADRARVDQLRPLAASIAAATEREVRLIRFLGGPVVEEVISGKEAFRTE